MDLLRIGAPGAETSALRAADGTLWDFSDLVADIDGAALSPNSLARIAATDPATLPSVPAPKRIGPCVAGVSKFICVGLKYANHAEESGMEVPAEPVISMKTTSAICGPNDLVELPSGSQKSD